MMNVGVKQEPAQEASRTGLAHLFTELVWGAPGKRRLLILGTGQLARDLCQSVLQRRIRYYDVVGFIDRNGARVGERLVNPAIVGTYDNLFQIVEYLRVSTIVACLEDRRGGLPVQTLLDLKALGLEVLDGHDMYEQVSGQLSIGLLRPSFLIFSAGFRRYRAVMALKRLIDLVASIVGIVLISPLCLAVAGLIRLDTPGPVFYRQVRVGFHGRPFMIWKFRSMRNDAEREGERWAEENDPRITRVGRWLRRWRLDELPQLLNVLRGEMSLVGPRPERPSFVQALRQEIPYYDVRHTVRPGVTGWAQTRFRYAGSTADAHRKLQYDLYYVKNLSVALDCRILIRTVRVVLQGDGAR